MTVYVDNMRGYARVDRGGRTVTGQWSHLLADDPAELAVFAAGLGLRPDWLRSPGTPGEHYDVVEAVRRRAVAAGAVPISYPDDTGNLIATKRLQASALDAAGRGWHVFPLRPGTKVPAVRHWEREATIDAEQIMELWTAQLRRRDEWHVPEPRNVGIACGPSELVVVDLDVEKPGQDRTNWPKQWLEYDITSGAEALAAVADLAFQTVPETYTVATPSGGRHLYFAAPASAVIRNSAGHPGPMIDVRGVGGYVVAAGSRLHPNLGPDELVVERSELAYRLIEDRPTADLPGWLTTAIAAEQRWDDSPAAGRPAIDDIRHRAPAGRSEGYGAAALRGEADRIRSTPAGQRNHTLNSAAYSLGQLVAAGALTRGRVVAALTDAAASAGLEPAEIAATIGSGLTAGARNPRTFQQAESVSRTADTTARSQRQPDIDGPSTAAPAPPDRTRDTPDKPVFDQAAFDQAVAVAIKSATRLVVDAAPDGRAAALREAAARVGRLLDVDGVDGQSALDALTAAAAQQVGMPAAEIETTIAAGIAKRHNWPIPNDNRPPPVTTGSVVAELAARRKQAELDAVMPHPERDASAGKQPQPVPPEVPSNQPGDVEQLPGGSPQGSDAEVAGAAHLSVTESQDLPAAMTTARKSTPEAGRPRDGKSEPQYTIDEGDAAYAGWLFAEAWDSFWTGRTPCHPADTLRIACEGEGLPTLGKSDRRFGPRPPAAFIEAPGEELIDREVFDSWSQSQRDEWYLSRSERAQAAATGEPRRQQVPDSPPPEAVAQASPAAEELAGTERLRGESTLSQPVDADALVRSLLAVLQSRGVIDREAWDAAVTGVAERSAPAASRDRVDQSAAEKPDPAAMTTPSGDAPDAREVTSVGHPDARSGGEDSQPDPGMERVDPGLRINVEHGGSVENLIDVTDAEPPAPQSPSPDEPDPVEAQPAPAEAPDRTANAHTVLDEAIGQARAAVSRLEANRAASHRSRDETPDAGVHHDRPAYWAEPEVEL